MTPCAESHHWPPVDYKIIRAAVLRMTSNPIFAIPDDTSQKFVALLTALEHAERKAAAQR
ncbi:hypothetical protein YH62_26535 [Rhizobium sp. LC145]|nr:hypothetical protein YH62_26535 [Rhizobium sp. LC145]